ATTSPQSGGTRQNHFEAEFRITSASATHQPGLFLSVSPDRGDGARMSYLGFADTADGIDVNFYDVQSVVDPAVFSQTLVADNLDRTTVHTAKFEIDFYDGASNDVVRIYIDGNLVHTGTTWENYFRFDDESNPTLADESRTVDSLLFRAGGTAAPATSGLGYLIDDISLSSSQRNNAPIADDMTILVPFNVGGTFELSASDPDGDNFDIASLGATTNGTLTGTAPVLTYTPNIGFFGSDSFTFSVEDSLGLTSNTATVTLITYLSPTCPTGGVFIGGNTDKCMKMVPIPGGLPGFIPEFYDPTCTAGVFVSAHDVCEAGPGSGTPIATFNISVSSGANGTTTPSGIVSVVSGTNQTFEMTPDSGFVVDDVLVDGASVGAVTTYTFSNVTAAHTISATFKTAPTSGGGSSGGGSSGGGGGGGGSSTPVTPATTTGQVLGAATGSAGGSCYKFALALSFGMRGAEVLELQKVLAAKGFLTATPNGNFGPATLAAVKAFQAVNGLEQIGTVGPKTRALLNVCAGTNPNQALIDELTKKLNALLEQIRQILAARGQ
ncbi:MAG: peptidoglycan-binding protein, partial [Minisyncoccia bacterium]